MQSRDELSNVVVSGITVRAFVLGYFGPRNEKI